MEKILIEIFKNKFIHRKDIGAEYFEGDFMDMAIEIEGVVNTDILKNDDVEGNNDKKYMKNIPEIEYVKLNCTNVRTIDEEENYDELVKIIYHMCKENMINEEIFKVFGDYIIYTYKKKDMKEQSLWNCDKDQTNFIIYTVVYNQKLWIIDKKGVRIDEIIIKPLLKNVFEKVRKIIIESHHDTNQQDNSMKIMTNIMRIALHTQNSKKILKYVAPYFSLIRI
jgi:hypothetical protein